MNKLLVSGLTAFAVVIRVPNILNISVLQIFLGYHLILFQKTAHAYVGLYVLTYANALSVR